jgi:mannose-6-phosphate isomerase-like protein (cupin superfamily)
MARAGQIIENPASGERVKWHLTASDTDGRLVRLELWVRPGGAVPLPHVHRRSEERFELISGTIALERDGERVELTRGQRATVAPGVAHTWWNTGDDEAHLMVELEPALRFEQVMETMFGLARDGKVGHGGVPQLLQLAVIANAFRDEVRPAKPPLPVQRVLFGILAPVGRALGRRPVYEAYSGPIAAAIAA